MDKKILSSFKEHENPKSKIPSKYIITSSIENTNGKEILFISLFSQEEPKEKADFKIFICGEEYISQKLNNDGDYIWSKACIENIAGYYEWYKIRTAVCDRLEDVERIEKYFKVRCDKPEDPYEAIINFQKKMMNSKLEVRHDAIKKKIDNVMAKVPELPTNFKKWVYDGPLGFSRYIYYKREGKRIKVFCTECKKEFVIQETGLTKKNIKHNNHGVCPKCNKKITYKAVGKSHYVEDWANFAIIQKYEDSIIVRYFWGEKEYKEHYRHPSVYFHEHIREIYYVTNKSLDVKRYEWSDFLQTGKVRWCNSISAYSNREVYLYTRNLKTVLKGTKWQYSCLYDFTKKISKLYIDIFLEEFIRHPAIEYFIKMKLYNFLCDKLFSSTWRPTWYGVNFKGKNMKEVLGVNAQQFQQMQRLNLSEEGLELIKSAPKLLTDQQVKWVEVNVNNYNFQDILRYTTATKAINYIKKQSKLSDIKYSLKNVLQDWCDYIHQCKDLKFDIADEFILYPRNLKEKHEEYTIMNKSKGFEKYDKGIRKAYQKLNELYSYSDSKLTIRPAESVHEIVAEGHRQRHCVGGINYVKGMAEGKTAIMLIRKSDKPKESFYTLELDPEKLSIRQCRGFKNCDTTTEVKKFLEKWKYKKLMKKSKKKVV